MPSRSLCSGWERPKYGSLLRTKTQQDTDNIRMPEFKNKKHWTSIYEKACNPNCTKILKYAINSHSCILKHKI